MERADPRRDGRSAIITAGPPGSGKSTAVRARVVNIGEYRVIDADEIKDALVVKAVADGIYGDLLSQVLPDGYGLAPRELASLVHNESVEIANLIRRISVDRKENIVVEGTLAWDGQGPRIFRDLADAGYVEVEVFGVDVDAPTAYEGALARWWEGRLAWIDGADQLGGRFTPRVAIDNCYDSSGQSNCTAHALEFINQAQSGEIPTVEVTILGRDAAGALTVIRQQHYKQ
nr:zeta toxin family protein [Mycolicibacterium fluoranthenivorans]